MTTIPTRPFWWQLHLGNALGSLALLALFLWTLPTWVCVPVAMLAGAANMNSFLAWRLHLDWERISVMSDDECAEFLRELNAR